MRGRKQRDQQNLSRRALITLVSESSKKSWFVKKISDLKMPARVPGWKGITVWNKTSIQIGFHLRSFNEKQFDHISLHTYIQGADSHPVGIYLI